MTRTEQLSRYVARTSFDDLPTEAVVAAKRVTLDLLGVAAAARPHPPGEAMVRYVEGLGGHPTATVIGSETLAPATHAALANGTLAADMELDDVHGAANLHASSVFVPALLAVGEAHDSTGRDWIAALAVAYDVGCRVSKSLRGRDQFDRGFHPTAVSGTFGATAGVARLLGLGPAEVAQALGLAGCQAAGLLTWKVEEEHYTKSLQSGIAARNAVTSGELVHAGYRGPLDTLDGRVNIFQSFSNGTDFDGLVDGLGSLYEIVDTSFKFYSCCRDIHSALDSLFEIMERGDLRADDIDQILVWQAPAELPLVDHNELTTHNLQYILAVGAYDRVVTRTQTGAERQRDPRVRALMERVRLLPDPALDELYPVHWAARVEVVTRSGQRYEASRLDPRGSAGTPLTDADLLDKFRAVTAGVLSSEAAERLVAEVATLDDLPSMRSLTEPLRGLTAYPRGEADQAAGSVAAGQL